MIEPRPIEEYWAEVSTYNPLKISRPDNNTVLFKIFIDAYKEAANHRDTLNQYYLKSHAQLYQDLIVQMFLNWKHNGYFVEFGATDGYDISNTYLLEKEFGWTGILAEPAKQWHSALSQNRNCHIDHSVIWRANEPVMFNERHRGDASVAVEYLVPENEPTGIDTLQQYSIPGLTLTSLLDKYNAPKDIDYVSMDTEGNELEILQTFDFEKYKVKFFSVEHNEKEIQRQKIFEFLSKKGYDRVLTNISNWDDFYILKEYNNLNELY